MTDTLDHEGTFVSIGSLAAGLLARHLHGPVRDDEGGHASRLVPPRGGEETGISRGCFVAALDGGSLDA